MGDVLIWIILIGVWGIYKVIRSIINKRKNKRIDFDEFDDIEKITQQELKEKRNLEYEADVLRQVYRDSYNDSIRESMENKKILHIKL